MKADQSPVICVSIVTVTLLTNASVFLQHRTFDLSWVGIRRDLARSLVFVCWFKFKCWSFALCQCSKARQLFWIVLVGFYYFLFKGSVFTLHGKAFLPAGRARTWGQSVPPERCGTFRAFERSSRMGSWKQLEWGTSLESSTATKDIPNFINCQTKHFEFLKEIPRTASSKHKSLCSCRARNELRFTSLPISTRTREDR